MSTTKKNRGRMLSVATAMFLAIAAVAALALRPAPTEVQPQATTNLTIYIYTRGWSGGGIEYHFGFTYGSWDTEANGNFVGSFGRTSGFAVAIDTVPVGYFPSIDCGDGVDPNNIPAGSVTCNLYVDKPATMTLNKTVVAWPSNEWTFGFTLLGHGTRTVSDSSPSATLMGLQPGQQYSLIETDWPIEPLGTTIDCDGTGSNLFTPEPGENVVCSVVNYSGVPVTIHKAAIGGDGTFNFTTSGPTNETTSQITTTDGDATGFGEGSTSFDLRELGAHTFVEMNQAGWIEGPVTCSIAHRDGTDTTGLTGSINIDFGDTVDCYVMNQRPNDVSMTKVVSGPTKVHPGDTTQFTITITNDSPDYWTSLLFMTDDLPEFLTPTAVNLAGCVIAGGDVNCKLQALEPGAHYTIVIDVVVSPDAPEPISLVNHATVRGLDVTISDSAQVAESQASLGATGINPWPASALALLMLGAGAGLLVFVRRRPA